MDKLIDFISWVALEMVGLMSLGKTSGKAIAIFVSVVGLVICLCVLMSNGKQSETPIRQPRPAFKSKEECYEAAEKYYQKCINENGKPFECAFEEYCDIRGCC